MFCNCNHYFHLLNLVGVSCMATYSQPLPPMRPRLQCWLSVLTIIVVYKKRPVLRWNWQSGHAKRNCKCNRGYLLWKCIFFNFLLNIILVAMSKKSLFVSPQAGLRNIWTKLLSHSFMQPRPKEWITKIVSKKKFFAFWVHSSVPIIVTIQFFSLSI